MPRTATVDAPNEDSRPNPLVTLVVRALRPLVLLLLKRGMTAYEFTEIARWVFADVAMDRRHFAVPGRDVWSTTKSRAAVLTGLTRREVDRLARLREPCIQSARRAYHRGIRVLHAWQEVAGYQDANGLPRVLAIKGGAGSLEHLVREYCRDITVRAMLDELEERGCVERVDHDHVRLLHGEYPAVENDVEEVEMLGQQAEHFMRAIERRLDPHSETSPVFDELDAGPIAREHQKALNDRLRNAAQSYMAQMKREISPLHQPALGDNNARLYIGIYHSFSD